MGKGRALARAMKSKITPFGRWAPPANARARCMRRELIGKTGGGRSGQIGRFLSASDACKVRGS